MAPNNKAKRKYCNGISHGKKAKKQKKPVWFPIWIKEDVIGHMYLQENEELPKEIIIRDKRYILDPVNYIHSALKKEVKLKITKCADCKHIREPHIMFKALGFPFYCAKAHITNKPPKPLLKTDQGAPKWCPLKTKKEK